MKVFLKSITLIILLITLSLDSAVTGQNSNEIFRKFKSLKIINSEFETILDSLLEEEKQCGNYNESFFWSISFLDLKDNQFVIEVTLKSEISATYDKYLGSFKIKEATFIVSGNRIHSDFFKECKNTTMLKSKKKKIPRPEDYSTWLYGYQKGDLYLRNAYSLPCN